MDWPMTHQGHHRGHGGEEWMGMQVPTVPAPMVFFGMMLGFVLGMMVGKMQAKKQMMWMMGGRPWGMGYGGMGGPALGGYGMGGYGMGMKGHHHHGHGAPMCSESHEKWPTAEERGMEAEEE